MKKTLIFMALALLAPSVGAEEPSLQGLPGMDPDAAGRAPSSSGPTRTGSCPT